MDDLLLRLDGLEWTRLATASARRRLKAVSRTSWVPVGLFNYATQETGGRVNFDNYLLSDTPPRRPGHSTPQLSTWRSPRADARRAPLPGRRLAATQSALAAATLARAGQLGTQYQIDAPEWALSYQLARLGVLGGTAGYLHRSGAVPRWEGVRGRAGAQRLGRTVEITVETR